MVIEWLRPQGGGSEVKIYVFMIRFISQEVNMMQKITSKKSFLTEVTIF